MISTPEAAFEAAFRAVISGDVRALLASIDPESMVEVKAARLITAEALKRARNPALHSDDAFDTYLAQHGVKSFEEMQALQPLLLLERSVSLRTGVLRGLECRTLGHVLETEQLAHVLFRLHLPDDPAPRRSISVATLRRHRGAWMLVASPMSPWVVPGFENLLLSEPDAVED